MAEDQDSENRPPVTLDGFFGISRSRGLVDFHSDVHRWSVPGHLDAIIPGWSCAPAINNRLPTTIRAIWNMLSNRFENSPLSQLDLLLLVSWSLANKKTAQNRSAALRVQEARDSVLGGFSHLCRSRDRSTSVKCVSTVAS